MARELITSDSRLQKRIKDGERRISDGDNLYLLNDAGRQPGWRFDYRFKGTRKTLSLGTYPAVPLALARDLRDQAVVKLKAGVNPSAERKQERVDAKLAAETVKAAESGAPLPGTFKHVALDWWHRQHCAKVSDGHAERTKIRFEQDVFPWLGNRLLVEIEPAAVLDVLRRVEDRGSVETAHRIRYSMSEVFQYGVACGIACRDSAHDVKKALKPWVRGKMAALKDPKPVAQLLRDIYAYQGRPTTRAALKLAPLVFQRPGMVRSLEWEHLDLDGAVWRIPAAGLKRGKQAKLTGEDHLVPLPRQAVELLRDLHPLTGHGRFVFPSTRGEGRPMSENTLNQALRAMGYDTQKDMTTHGFRAMARTMMVERLKGQPGIDKENIEAHLAHVVDDALGDTYNRAKFFDERVVMVQTWADYLDQLRESGGTPPRLRLAA